MKLKTASIVLNIFNIIVMVLLVVGIFLAVLAISVICGIFGPEAMNAVMRKLLSLAAFLIVPDLFIFVFTIVSLPCVICKKEEKLMRKPKRVDVFLVMFIICLVLSALCTIAPFAYALFQMAKDEASFGVDSWDGIGVVILYVVLEGFSIITSAISIKYLNNIQNKIEYKEEN